MSFRRAQPAADAGAPAASAPVGAGAHGIKPTTSGGLGLCSSGHKELDGLLGGGLALGSSTLLSVDKGTCFGQTLMGYCLAEGVSMRHATLLLAPDERTSQRLLEVLPYNRHLASASEEAGGSEALGPSVPPPPPLPAVYCCSYDLSRPLQPHILAASPVTVFLPPAASSPSPSPSASASPSLPSPPSSPGSLAAPACLGAVLDAFVARTLQFVAQHSGSVVRVYVPRLDLLMMHHGGSSSGSSDDPRSLLLLLRFLLQMRAALQPPLVPAGPPTRATLLLSLLPECAPAGAAGRLAALCDCHLTVETFAGLEHRVPHEFQAFHGFFRLAKAPRPAGSLCAYTGAGPGLTGSGQGAARMGLRRDKRKLHVEPLHLPPEESRAFGAAGTDAQLERRLGRAGAAGGYSTARASAATSSTTTSSSGSSGSGSTNYTGGVGGGVGSALAYSSAPLVAAAREGGAPLSDAAAEPTETLPPSQPPRLGLAERLHLRRQQGGGGGGVGGGSALLGGGLGGGLLGGLGGARGLGGVSISSVSAARTARAQAGQRGEPGEEATGPCGLGLGKLDF